MKISPPNIDDMQIEFLSSGQQFIKVSGQGAAEAYKFLRTFATVSDNIKKTTLSTIEGGSFVFDVSALCADASTKAAAAYVLKLYKAAEDYARSKYHTNSQPSQEVATAIAAAQERASARVEGKPTVKENAPKGTPAARVQVPANYQLTPQSPTHNPGGLAH